MYKLLLLRTARLLHENSLDAFLAWRKSKNLRDCARAVDAGSKWDQGNCTLASKKSFIRHKKHIRRLQSARSIWSLLCLLVRE
jgi:hypothetical protein